MAFAAVLSLTNILATLNITRPEWDDLDSLFFTLQRSDDECYRGIDRTEILELEAKIIEAAWMLEDVLESYQISQGLHQKTVDRNIHSFFEIARKLRKEYEGVLENSCVVTEEVRIIRDDDNNSTTVGLSDLSEEIITGLLDGRSFRKVFSIWGMAGIGKTHLARDIYHHPLIVQHFEIRLWVNVGSKHRDIVNMFVDILAQMEKNKPRYLFKEKDEHELRYLIWNSLADRRFLVAFDDIWSLNVLRDLIGVLPPCKVLLTTRIYLVERLWFDIQDCPMPFLSNEESWDLLRVNVFAEKSFPTQLEIAGRRIAEICEGLPLLILTVADILRGHDQTQEFWNKVAEKKTTTFRDAYDRIYKVLVLSYDYLPQQCKACFLYMGVFPQSHVIPTSKLIRL